MAEGRLRLAIYFTGGLIVVLLFIHLSLFSYWFVEGGYYTDMDWSQVSARMQNTLWDIFYLIFLSVVLLHSYSGIKGILYEYVVGETGRKMVNILLSLIWIVAFIYGILPIFA